MTRNTTVSRRTALKTLAAAAVGGASTATATASSESVDMKSTETTDSGDSPTPDANGSAPTEPKSAQKQRTQETGIFDGTVDRIVDGEHVVILVENDNRVIDQFVEPRKSLPSVGEGDAVGVWLVNGALRSVWPR